MSGADDLFACWGLTRVINASGTMTSIGASRAAPQVIDAVAGILPHFVSIDELQARASAVIAEATGAEAGCVTSCSAAAITMAVAAAITGCDLAAIERLPDCAGRQRRVAVQMGHMVNYGAPIPQAITLAGAELVPLGTAALCELYHLRAALAEDLAAAVYVVSHHTVREGELPLDLFVEVCQEFDVPVIVDMASEYDLHGPLQLGASLVAYSGHKFLGGPTSGIAAGARDFVRALYLQNRGIGRTMKVGKESILGAMTALEHFVRRDAAAIARSEEEILAHWQEELTGNLGLTVTRHTDWTGNPITRLQVSVDPTQAGLFAWELGERLAARDPRIVVRDDLVEHGALFLDPCNLDREEAALVTLAIKEETARARSNGDGCRTTWSEVKRGRARSPLSWLVEGEG